MQVKLSLMHLLHIADRLLFAFFKTEEQVAIKSQMLFKLGDSFDDV